MQNKQTQDRITGLAKAMHAEFTQNLAPALSAEHKYSAAMMKRGLEILVAHLQAEQSADTASASPQDSLSPVRLARALRNREAGGLPDDLRDQLAKDVSRRRKQANPGAF